VVRVLRRGRNPGRIVVGGVVTAEVDGREAPIVSVAVRALAEFACRSGDIHRRFQAMTEGREGIAAQQRVQQDRPSGYERERRVETCFEAHGVRLRLSGRVDGCDLSGAVPLVEEFKTSRVDPDALHAHLGPVHRAQLEMYAALLATEHDAPIWMLQLVYVHPDTLATRSVPHEMTRDELGSFLTATCERFCAWLADFYEHRRARDAAFAAAAFPFAQFRPEQRQLARYAYSVLRDGGAMWAEAPTGIGKTVGTLFPAVKTMAAGHVDRALFLTSRGTGQAAALDALRLIASDRGDADDRASGGVTRRRPLRTIALTARDKCCFLPEPNCDPAHCRYARGHYDRRLPAMAALLEQGEMTRDVIDAIAREHAVCPFELSLDCAVWSDVIVCDYNYVFDPVVRLQRLQGMFADRTAVLVDEAHQLADRVRDTLSAELSRARLGAMVNAGAGECTEAVRRSARALDRRLLALRRTALGRAPRRGESYELEVQLPDSLVRAVDGLIVALTEQARGDEPLDGGSALFEMLSLQRTLGWYREAGWLALLSGTGADCRLALRCLDPAEHIASTVREQHAVIGFSATLTPLSLFHRLHGVTQALTARVASPFLSEQLGVFVVPDIDTRYRARQRSLERLVALIANVVNARRGNYLVALPSFEYLDAVAAAISGRWPGLNLRRQTPSMDVAAREAFVAAFGSSEPVLGLAVQGGLFTESVDLPGDALIGMIVVGVGLPPPSIERDRIAVHFRAGSEEHAPAHALDDPGYLAAYRQPAMTRVVQAAGRLIRTEQDRGVLCLVDDRFQAPQYRRFFPDFWQPRVVLSNSVARQLDAFWNPG
jgi:DNA excision repair protein ERCC-2